MKILFYLEPHPIRNSHISFEWIGRELLKMLTRGKGCTAAENLHFRIFGNEETKAQCARRSDCDFTPYLCWSDFASEESLEAWNRPWGADSIKVWEDLMLGTGEVSDFYYDILAKVHDTYPFDVLINWSTNGMLDRFSSDFNVRRISMELGFSRSPFRETVVFDPRGVNGNSVLLDLPLEVLDHQEAYTADEDLLRFSKTPYATLQSWKLGQIGSKSLETLTGDQKVALLPLQLKDDSNMIYFSRFKNSVEFLEATIPNLIEAGYVCVVKPHPGRFTREINMEDALLTRNYCESTPGVIWCEDIENPASQVALLNRADLVVTVNSSTGFEAVFFDKVVCLEGTAAYGVKGVFPTLEEFLGGSFSEEVYLDRVSRLRSFCLETILHPRESAFELSYFAEIVASTNLAWENSGGDFGNYFSVLKSARAGQIWRLNYNLFAQKLGRDEIGGIELNQAAKEPHRPKVSPAAQELARVVKELREHLDIAVAQRDRLLLQKSTLKENVKVLKDELKSSRSNANELKKHLSKPWYRKLLGKKKR